MDLGGNGDHGVDQGGITERSGGEYKQNKL